jgi:hypothetical protein
MQRFVIDSDLDDDADTKHGFDQLKSARPQGALL